MLTTQPSPSDTDDTAQRMRWQRLTAAALAGHLVLAFYLVERVGVNADEGWWLYAAGQVGRGLSLYTDVLFFQPPVMPHVYGGMLELGPGMLLGARWISLFFMVMAMGLMTLTVVRLAGLRTAALVVVLVGLHPMLVGVGVWAKPYALALFLLCGGLFLWSGAPRPVRVVVGAMLFGPVSYTHLTLPTICSV